jgi:MFS family permease
MTFIFSEVLPPSSPISFSLKGRKYTFLVTLLIMGVSTTAIGLLPNYDTIGMAAPILLLILRLLQGLALGGEYGRAATYVAEHAPAGKRGFYTSFIQTTATLGLFLSLGVILATRQFMGEEEFARWGWRIPFLLSVILVAISVVIRRKLQESPVFQEMKASGKGSKYPLRDSFLNPENRRMVIIALLGATAGQGVIWYTGQFYALYYLQTVLKVDFVVANKIIAVALLFATPFFIFFGWLSDKIGRKPIMMAGRFIAALTYIPIYKGLAHYSGHYSGLAPDTFMLTLLVFIQVFYVTMVYGPIAAFLVELFPTKIRYTSMSLPYHIGNGVFGGMVPLLSGLTLWIRLATSWRDFITPSSWQFSHSSSA